MVGNMKYQLVIQFRKNVNHDLDWLISMKDKLLVKNLNGVGSGEMNIFTDTPIKIFANLRICTGTSKNRLSRYRR